MAICSFAVQQENFFRRAACFCIAFWAFSLFFCFAVPVWAAERAPSRGMVSCVQPVQPGEPASPRSFPFVRIQNDDFCLWMPHFVEEGGILPIRLDLVPKGPLSFVWQDQRVALTDLPSDKMLLLPAPLDGGKKPHILQLFSSGKSISVPVEVIPVRWPEQRITVPHRYVAPPPERLARIERERKQTKRALASVSLSQLGRAPFLRPVKGGVSSVFGGKRLFNGEPRSRHQGVDLRAPEGTPVRAAASGKVLLAADQYFSGKIIWIDHGLGVVTAYCHLSSLGVKNGDFIRAGQVIGLSGSTGRVTGPHLHFTARVWNTPVNPLALFVIPQPR